MKSSGRQTGWTRRRPRVENTPKPRATVLTLDSPCEASQEALGEPSREPSRNSFRKLLRTSREGFVSILVRGVCALALSVSLALGVCSAIEVEPNAWAIAAGAAVIVVQTILARWPSLFRGFAIVAVISAAVALALQVPQLISGLQLVANQAAHASAAHQPYLYEYFNVDLPASAEAQRLIIGLAFVFACTSLAIGFSTLRRMFALGAVVVALYACVQVYLGVAAEFPWNALVAAALMACVAASKISRPVAGRSPRGKSVKVTHPEGARPSFGQAERVSAGALAAMAAAAFAAVLAVSCIVFVAYPSAWHQGNPTLSRVETVARDAAASGDSAIDILSESVQSLLSGNFAGDPGAAGSAANEDSGAEQLDDQAPADEAAPTSLRAGSSLEAWQILLMLLALAVIGLATWYTIKRAVVRKRFSAPDARKAIDAQFRHLMRRLHLFGIAFANQGALEYKPQVALAIDSEFAERYGDAAALWQRTKYSTAEVTREDADAMRNHLDWLGARIDKASGAWVKMRVHALCYTRN